MPSPQPSPTDGTPGNAHHLDEARREFLRVEILDTVPELTVHPLIVEGILDAWGRPDRKLEVVYAELAGVLTARTAAVPELKRRNNEALRALESHLAERGALLIPTTGVSWSTDTTLSPCIARRLEAGQLPSYIHAFASDGGRQLMARDSTGAFTRDERFDAQIENRARNFKVEEVLDGAQWVIDRINRRNFDSTKLFNPLDFNAIGLIDPSSPPQQIYLQPHVHPRGVAGTPDSNPSDRVSLYFYAHTLEERDTIERLLASQLPSHAIVCCVDEDFNNVRDRQGVECASRYCLDVTPVHKGIPILYLDSLILRACDRLFTLEDHNPMTVVNWYCGDAANDLVAARVPNVKVVCFVGGSNAELTRYRLELAAHGKIVYVEHDPAVQGAASILKAFGEVDALPGAS